MGDASASPLRGVRGASKRPPRKCHFAVTSLSCICHPSALVCIRDLLTTEFSSFGSDLICWVCVYALQSLVLLKNAIRKQNQKVGLQDSQAAFQNESSISVRRFQRLRLSLGPYALLTEIINMAYSKKAHTSESKQGSHLPAVIPIGDNEEYEERLGTIYGADAFILPIALDTSKAWRLMHHARPWSFACAER